MLKRFILAAGAVSLTIGLSFNAHAQDAKVAAAIATPATTPAPVDPARLAIAQKTVGKLIPPGTYTRIMKDMMDTMANGLVQQMMGLDASAFATAAGVKDGAEDVKGKTIGELAAAKDPNFKERMDITFKVMFAEMGGLMTEMEPVVRDAMARIYARKYSVKELTDMNTFFGTPSGAAFANNFMATFTDKEMMDASFGMMPKLLEAMPGIMKKVEAATAHLPPIPGVKTQESNEASVSFADLADAPECAKDDDLTDCSADDTAAATASKAAWLASASADAAADPYANETSDEPWYVQENWTASQRKKVNALYDKYTVATDKSSAIYEAYQSEYDAALASARDRLKPEYDKLPKPEAPMAAEDIPANAPPPPVIISTTQDPKE